jgi:hypothetical protein
MAIILQKLINLFCKKIVLKAHPKVQVLILDACINGQINGIQYYFGDT